MVVDVSQMLRTDTMMGSYQSDVLSRQSNGQEVTAGPTDPETEDLLEADVYTDGLHTSDGGPQTGAPLDNQSNHERGLHLPQLNSFTQNSGAHRSLNFG